MANKKRYFKYIGSGDNSPERIVYMGEVEFQLYGEHKHISNRHMLKKISGNKCFSEVDAYGAPFSSGSQKAEKVEKMSEVDAYGVPLTFNHKKGNVGPKDGKD